MSQEEKRAPDHRLFAIKNDNIGSHISTVRPHFGSVIIQIMHGPEFFFRTSLCYIIGISMEGYEDSSRTVSSHRDALLVQSESHSSLIS
jgi:hypothetical protein